MLLADALSAPIPAPDRFGVPGHWSIFLVLYHVTFVVHLLFMNFALGGSILFLVNEVRSLWSRNRDELRELNRRLFLALPIAVSFAITFGVAPLLFVQVLYGQFFYTANILIGLPWMGVIGILLVVFYLVYGVRFGGPGRGRVMTSAPWRIALSAMIALGFLAIAFLLTSNAVWELIPQVWRERYQSGQWTPWPPELHFWPRYLHNVVGGTAVACLLVVGLSRMLVRRRIVADDWANRTARRFLLAAFILTCIQAVDGIGIVAMLPTSVGPAEQTVNVRGGMLYGVTLAQVWGWRLGILAGGGAAALMLWSLIRPMRLVVVWAALGLILVTLFGMSMAREAVRSLYLKPYFQLSDWNGSITWQFGATAMFLISFVIAIAVVAWMLRLVWKAPLPEVQQEPIPLPAPIEQGPADQQPSPPHQP